MTATTLSVAQLQRGLDTLPQELFDKIASLVVTDDGGSRELSWGYKPPVQLQINRKIRQEFSQSYYDSPEPWTTQSGPGSLDHGLRVWLQSLTKETQKILYRTPREIEDVYQDDHFAEHRVLSADSLTSLVGYVPSLWTNWQYWRGGPWGSIFQVVGGRRMGELQIGGSYFDSTWMTPSKKNVKAHVQAKGPRPKANEKAKAKAKGEAEAKKKKKRAEAKANEKVKAAAKAKAQG